MEYGDRLLDELVQRAAERVKDPATGYIHRKHLIDEVDRDLERGELHISAAARLRRASTETQVDKFLNRRKPKPTGQDTIYDANYLLPLGDGKRVFMCDATISDLLAYQRGVEENRKRVNKRASETDVYITERVAALEANPGRSLGWVETHVFGHSTDEDPSAHIYEEENIDD